MSPRKIDLKYFFCSLEMKKLITSFTYDKYQLNNFHLMFFIIFLYFDYDYYYFYVFVLLFIQ